MAARIRLALVYKYDESWIAGTYYLSNLIYALKTLPEKWQPEIILYTDTLQDKEHIERIGYPRLQHKKYLSKYNAFERAANKISRVLLNRNIFEKRMTDKDLDYAILLRRSWDTDLLSNSKKIFWIPDCQELLMPSLFFNREYEGRKHVYNEILTSKSKILFSSKATKKDFLSFYPQTINPLYVIPFAVSLPDFKDISFQQTASKYHITKPYFIVPNQFWKHKNHKLVLEAVLMLKSKGIEVSVVFTGKELDFRNPEYPESIRKLAQKHDLLDQIKFLGFIPHKEQLCLMANCIAIIQPSLFEGWSTVVEDAKSLNKWILLSDIPVHREQIKMNVSFFKPDSPLELANLIQNTEKEIRKVEKIDYNDAIKHFGKEFVKMLRE